MPGSTTRPLSRDEAGGRLVAGDTNMLIAALIAVLSLMTMVQFAVFSWRARLVRMADSPLPMGLDTPGEPACNFLQSNDFQRLHAYQEVCPDLTGGNRSNLRSVYLYYRFLQSLDALAEAILPKGLAAAWAQGEMELCGRYARVVLCQRMEHNRALLAEFQSY
jgi:hypothetical protein